MHGQEPTSPRANPSENGKCDSHVPEVHVSDSERQAFVQAVAAALTLACDGDAEAARSLLREQFRLAEESGRRELARALGRVIDAAQGLGASPADRRPPHRTW